jgi:hypothetical protein
LVLRLHPRSRGQEDQTEQECLRHRHFSFRVLWSVSEAAKFSLERGHKDRSLMFDTVHAVL